MARKGGTAAGAGRMAGTERMAGAMDKAADEPATRRRLAHEPDDDAAAARLAGLLAGRGALAEARRWLDRAVALRPTPERRTARTTLDALLAQQAEAAGDRGAAQDRWRAVLASGAADAAAALAAHDALARLHAADDLALAAEHALAAWRATPGDATRAGNAWQLLTHMGEAAEVERFERRVAEREDAAGLVGLGNALRRAGHALRAERTYRRALERFPEVSMTLSRLACLCAEQMRLEEADALFLEAARRHGGRDVVTRVSPAFLADLKAGPPPAGVAVSLAEGRGVADRPLLLYASCDSRYFGLFVPTMLRSLVEESRLDAAICLHVVNPDAACREAMLDLVRRYGPERFVLAEETVDLAPFGAQAKTYYACARFLLLPELLRRYGKPMLMLDVDLMAIRDLKPLLATSASADLGLMTNALKRLDLWSLLYADVVHLHPTERTLRFLELTRRYIRHFLKPGTAHWFLDQAALAGAFLAGFTDEPAPRFAWYPTDIHSSTIMVDAGGRYWADDHAYFYSVRATGGGQTAMARAVSRAGTLGELRAFQAAQAAQTAAQVTAAAQP